MLPLSISVKWLSRKMRVFDLFLLVPVVGEVLCVPAPSVGRRVVILDVVSVVILVVFLALGSQQFLDSDDTGDEESQLGDDQSLESDQSEESKDQGDQSGSLQLQEEEKGQEHLLLLLAT